MLVDICPAVRLSSSVYQHKFRLLTSHVSIVSVLLSLGQIWKLTATRSLLVHLRMERLDQDRCESWFHWIVRIYSEPRIGLSIPCHQLRPLLQSLSAVLAAVLPDWSPVLHYTPAVRFKHTCGHSLAPELQFQVSSMDCFQACQWCQDTAIARLCCWRNSTKHG